jgi:hypothetical protein
MVSSDDPRLYAWESAGKRTEARLNSIRQHQHEVCLIIETITLMTG